MKSQPSDVLAFPDTYNVAIDQASVTSSETGYFVHLTGPVDSNWIESYRQLRTESGSLFRFDLEERTILFFCRKGDVPTDVESVLKILESLVQRTNAHASRSLRLEYPRQTSRFGVTRDAEADPAPIEGEETIVAPQARSTDPSLEASLILIAHPFNRSLGTRFRLSPRSSMVVGRAKSADISLPEVNSLSRHHLRLTYRNESVVVEDLGSTNGTYVNDERIEQATVLRSGDRFQVGAAHFKFLQDRDIENAYHLAIHDLVVLDGLTQIANKRRFEEEAERELGRARRYGRPLSLILFDADRFKLINDLHGHLCGDLVLKKIVELTQPFLRAEQVFARVGGEEFAILCPEAAPQGARLLAERVRSRLSRHEFSHATAAFAVTCSFGIAGVGREIASVPALYEAADRALYESKNAGRNRVTVWKQRRMDRRGLTSATSPAFEAGEHRERLGKHKRNPGATRSGPITSAALAVGSLDKVSQGRPRPKKRRSARRVSRATSKGTKRTGGGA